jgi:mannose-6-phosphate isomerase-like protein (cupin superfamily)
MGYIKRKFQKKNTSMEYRSINLHQKFSLFRETWIPRIIAQLNDYHIKIVRIRGHFIWHTHPETDEVFMVLEGSMTIDFKDGKVDLESGELFVVPRGVEHKPFAEKECKILLIEPAGTVNTGDSIGERTVQELDMI